VVAIIVPIFKAKTGWTLTRPTRDTNHMNTQQIDPAIHDTADHLAALFHAGNLAAFTEALCAHVEHTTDLDDGIAIDTFQTLTEICAILQNA
jgi:hypothetical protein